MRCNNVLELAMSVQIEQYRTAYKNPRYYCEPGPAVVCDEVRANYSGISAATFLVKCEAQGSLASGDGELFDAIGE